MKVNIAKKILIPPIGTFRTVFLYVGQGDATLMIVPDGENFQYILIDCNKDEKNEGIDLKKMLQDLLSDNKINIFINTHPHDDHLKEIDELYKDVGIKEIWHSGHNPGKMQGEYYKKFTEIMGKIGKNNVHRLFGTNTANKIRDNEGEEMEIKKIGDIDYIVISPAEFLVKDIEGESAKTRYNRIHEQCAVIKFTYGKKPKHILITGDAEKCAWEKNIVEYHKAHLPSNVLSAVHHGSRTFFKENEDDEEYTNHIDEIDPEYIIISAPRKKESPHEHPHDDAVELYKKYVGEDGLIHMGKNRECVIVDIDNEGNLNIITDNELVNEYKYTNNEDDNKNIKKSSVAIQTDRIDEKKFGEK